jgi:hypothetical protein
VRGFWEEEHFDDFVRELHAAIASFPQSGKPPMTLYNYTHAWIQPQAVVTKMRALAKHPAMIDRKVAMYTEGVLARQQAKRVTEGRDNMRVFDCRADALAFLCSEAPLKDGQSIGTGSRHKAPDTPTYTRK